MDIRIPELAEGVETGTVVDVLVSEGDTVAKDQTLLELETQKAVAPIPSPVAGTVQKILVTAGSEVSVGQVVMTIAEGGASETSGAAVAGKPAADAAASTRAAAPQPAAEPSAASAPAIDDGNYEYQSSTGAAPPASPAVRKMARQLGIDLRRVRGSERGGRITLDDIRRYIASLQSAQGRPAPGTAGAAASAATSAAARPSKPAASAAPAVDFAKWGPVRREPLSSLRKTIGERMAASWSSVPHVTQFDEADITDLMELRKQHAKAYEARGGHLTLTAILLKILAPILRDLPMFNASLDEARGEVVHKDYIHLGVAVDTEAGLIVPVVRDVDKKDLLTISRELSDLAERTRQRKMSLEELQGASFTVSNLGSIGGTFFTPIVNPPQSAILGVGRGVLKPAVKDGRVTPRLMLPLGVSYDHRVIDGADGARFIRAVVEALERAPEDQIKL